MLKTIKFEILASIEVKRRILQDKALMEKIREAAEVMIDALKTGGKIIFCGNGGSAADAQHLTAEFVGRFRKERCPLPAIAITTNTSILTAIGNDYGYDEVFARQFSALAGNKDVVVVISTSGNSKNIMELCSKALSEDGGPIVIGLLGHGGGAQP